MLGLIGALLVGLGVITLVAANWDALSKAAKLALIGTALWASYGGAWLAQSGRHPRLAQALLLLGLLVFGAAIALVAQIFHLPANAPGGALLWCAGAFAVALIGPSQPAAVVGVALAALWTALAFGESWRFGPVHWWFLPVWLAWIALIVTRRWQVAAHVALLALLLWSGLSLEAVGESIGSQAAARLTAGCWMLALAIGFAGAHRNVIAEWAELLRRYALVAVLATAFLIANLPQWSGEETVVPRWLTAGAMLPALLGFLLAWRAAPDAARRWPWLSAAALAVLFLGSGLAGDRFGDVVTIVLHLAYVGGTIGLIAWAYAAQDRFSINLGFVFLGIALLDIYFDNAWLLFDRGLFFIGGGLLLLALAWLLERQRRRLLGDLEAQP